MSRDPEHGRPESTARDADSAGRPWAGRHFDANPSASDDGAADPALSAALQEFARGTVGQSVVIDAVRTARLLIPLVAHAGDTGHDEHGRLIDKTQELSIVTVSGPDGRAVLPAFTSVTTMSAWNPRARPVPAEGTRVALAAASEQTELVVLDPTSDTEFVLRRPALWAIGQGEPWRPGFEDPAVESAFRRSIERELAVHGVRLEAGDPRARLAGPELIVVLELVAGLNRPELDAVLRRLASRWAADDDIATRVDSLTVRLTTA
jgi:hypothetical protein